MTVQLETPFTMIVAGPSSSGKTSWTCHLLNNLNEMLDKPVQHIVYCYSEESSIRSVQKCLNENALKKIKFVQGVPEEFENNNNQGMLVIIDDLMLESYSKRVCSLFIKDSHHSNMSVILISQNIFYSSKHSRNISLNAKYLCIFKSPRDGSQFRFLAQQIYPENAACLYNVYKSITEEQPFSYLFIDLTQKAHRLLRFRTNIFDKDHSIVYCAPTTDPNIQYASCFNEQTPIVTFKTGQYKIT